MFFEYIQDGFSDIPSLNNCTSQLFVLRSNWVNPFCQSWDISWSGFIMDYTLWCRLIKGRYRFFQGIISAFGIFNLRCISYSFSHCLYIRLDHHISFSAFFILPILLDCWFMIRQYNPSQELIKYSLMPLHKCSFAQSLRHAPSLLWSWTKFIITVWTLKCVI